MKKFTKLIQTAIGVALMAPAASWAVTVSYSGAGSAVADLTTETYVINVTDDLIISDLTLDFSTASSTWVGDLIVTLEGPSGSIISIMNGVGSPDNTGAGDSSNLLGDYTFEDGGADLWAAASAATGGEVIAPGSYFATDIDGSALSFAGIFGGEESAGDWTLSVADRATGDDTSFDEWTLNITGDAAGPTPMPLPGTLLLIGAGLVGFSLTRRS